LNWIAKKLNVERMEDWHNISREQLIANYGSSLISKHGSMINLLAHVYPKYPWDIQHVPRSSKSHQWLYKILRDLLPIGTDIKTCYRHPLLKYPNNHKMEVDIYIPSLSLALEYQGIQHYEGHYLWSPLDSQRERDELKRSACREKNIILVEIPYWWDKSKSSLASTLYKYCPIQCFEKYKDEPSIPMEPCRR
jgi:hypothetical protein